MNDIPTISEIYDKIIQDFENNLNTNLQSWGRYFIKAYAMVVAGWMYMLFVKNYFVYRNMLPDTADSTKNGGTLERWGLIKLNRLPFKATQGKYIIEGSATIGSVIPVNRIFTSERNGQNYRIEQDYTFQNEVGSFEVKSFEGGEAVRLSVGEKLTLTSPASGVNREFIVTQEVVEPLDAEPIEDYRAKVIESFRYKSRGGAAMDYKFWAFGVTGVRNTYPYTGATLPNVVLYIESQTGNGIASPALINDVKNYVEGPGRRPLGIKVNYLSVYLNNIIIDIDGGAQITTSDQMLITDNIREYLDKKRPFVESVNVAKNDVINTNEIIAIIQNTNSGVAMGNITVKFNNTQMVSYLLNKGEIPNLVAVNFN